jgi:hypothetical protein
VDLIALHRGNVATQSREGLYTSKIETRWQQKLRRGQTVESQLRRKTPNDWTFPLDFADRQWVALALLGGATSPSLAEYKLSPNDRM